jgi:hypothetical protein
MAHNDEIKAPIMPLKYIRDVLKKENSDTFQVLRNAARNMGSGHADDLLSELRSQVNDEIDAIKDYADADRFIGKYYRMNLTEWANSLGNWGM